MRSSSEVPVTPSVLEWARRSAGFDVEQVAKALRVRVEEVVGWERGSERPSLRKLEELAREYRRPLGAFFLPSPPAEPPLPRDFRVLPGEKKKPLSPRTRLAVRRAHWLRSKAEAISQDLGEKTAAVLPQLQVMEVTESAAQRERRRLKVPLATQFGWRSNHEALREWKARLEGLGVLVFQMRIPLEDARGFSIRVDRFPAIVVSAADAVAARVFTLFHEYAHLGLGSSAICFPDEGSPDLNEPIERFCNAFAGSLLVPKDALEERWDERIRESLEEGDETPILPLTRLFRVSRRVILRRALDAGLVSRSTHAWFTDRWNTEWKSRPPRRGGFGESAPRRCVNERGRAFIHLVLDALDRNAISGRDAVDYLGVKAEQIEALRPLVGS